MSDADATKKDSEKPDDFPKKEYQVTDGLLQFLVSSAIKAPSKTAALPITLSIGGTLVSGFCVSADAFIDGTAESLRTMFPPGNEESEKMIADIAQSLKLLNAKWRDDQQNASKRLIPQFIHLRDVTFSTAPQEKLRWFRVRIEAVDGFSIGSDK